MLKITAMYRYIDPTSGQLLASKSRKEDNGTKTFEWNRPGAKTPGLSPIKETDLPLYNAHLLRKWNPEKAVFLVEGEKSCDALLDKYNALALCLPGGASARKFSALESLRDRDVVLWPDNDEQGIMLMRRIKSELETIAKRVRVFLPTKQDRHADAYDYTETHSRGDLAKAIAIISSNSTVEEVPDGFVWGYPDIGCDIEFCFTNIRYQAVRGQEGVWAKVAVWEREPDSKKDGSWKGRINLESGSSRDSASGSLQKLFGGDTTYWTRLVHKACSAIIDITNKDESRFVNFLELPKSLVATYLVDKFLLDSGATIFYGRGDRSKTTVATLIGICIATDNSFLGRTVEQTNVIYVNFEGEDDDDARRRVRRLSQGMNIPIEEIDKHFFYKNARGQRLEQILPNLRRQIQELGVGLVIIDSISKISVGDVESHDAPNTYFGMIDTLKIPTFSLAHVPKPPSHRDFPDYKDPEYAYGSTFWRDLPRAGWQVHRYDFDDSSTAHLVLKHRKYNTTGKMPEFGVSIQFDDRKLLAPRSIIKREEIDYSLYLGKTKEEPETENLRI